MGVRVLMVVPEAQEGLPPAQRSPGSLSKALYRGSP